MGPKGTGLLSAEVFVFRVNARKWWGPIQVPEGRAFSGPATAIAAMSVKGNSPADVVSRKHRHIVDLAHLGPERRDLNGFVQSHQQWPDHRDAAELVQELG